MRKTVCDGVTFFEALPEGAQKNVKLNVTLDSFFKSSQLSSLNDVKKLLAKQCHDAGCNSVVEFQYGQKSLGFWDSIFSRDNVCWYGNGYAANVADTSYSKSSA